MKCCQCSNPAMFLATDKEVPLCLHCYFKLSQILQVQREESERWINFLQDEMSYSVGLSPVGPRFPPRPKTVHIGGVKLNNINVSNSVVGTINTGSIGVIDQSISALIQGGEPALADALKGLSQAIVSSGDLSPNQKNDLIEIMSVIATEAATPKESRRSSVVKTLLDRGEQIMAMASDLTDVFQKLWPVLIGAFQ
jgi:hypothetical protein